MRKRLAVWEEHMVLGSKPTWVQSLTSLRLCFPLGKWDKSIQYILKVALNIWETNHDHYSQGIQNIGSHIKQATNNFYKMSSNWYLWEQVILHSQFWLVMNFMPLRTIILIIWVRNVLEAPYVSLLFPPWYPKHHLIFS